MTHEELVERVKAEVFGLKWSAQFYDGNEITAGTFLGEYDIAPMLDDNDGWLWNCRFEGISRRAATFEDAKSDAEAHWLFLINAEDQAREAIRITGEACAASLNHEATLVTNPILQLAYEASATTILSLTQGNKT